jgi:ribokinase
LFSSGCIYRHEAESDRDDRLLNVDLPNSIIPYVIDTTGAGDAFIGSFARYLAGGLALEAALTDATRYSAFSVTRHGAQKSFATEAEFAAFSAKEVSSG